MSHDNSTPFLKCLFGRQKGSNMLSGYKIVEEITTGGSDRRFYRVKKNSISYILIVDEKVDHYVRLLKHLYKIGIAVPELICIKDKLVIVEDLGKNSLYALVKKGCRNLLNFYKMAIEELVKLQIYGYPDAPVSDFYDYEHIKWEQDYFKTYFLDQFCNISRVKIAIIEDELKILRNLVYNTTRPISNFLMHRDYQSQNILIKDGRIRIIDFQSARIGPLTYDLASLLRDACVKISKNREHQLIEYYLKCLKKQGIEINRRFFLKVYQLTAIQRNMQALGAFANLSLNKGKAHFKEYIQNGVCLLKRGLKEGNFVQCLKLLNSIEFRKLKNRSGAL